jgi:hypothetical protein
MITDAADSKREAEVVVLAEKLLAAVMVAAVSLDSSRKPDEWKQAMIMLAFDMAERFIAECERRCSKSS